MNKYDIFSIPHLILYLDAMSQKAESFTGKKIVYWVELKEVLKLCNVNNLTVAEMKKRR